MKQKSDRKTVTEKIYAGLIGMDAGMRLGAPVENPFWTYERLRDHYGDIRDYLRVHKNHTADDDVNGPVLLVRALTDRLPGCRELTPEMCGEAWLNYTRFGKGMFWWGGEDVSTEHRAYMNLRRGVRPPLSGSAEMNGKTASEQIGGQIFVDTWGLINPGDPERAAEYAVTAASVSHDGSGLHGAAFMAACVAAAFEAGSVDEILDAGLSVIPGDCDYAGVVRAVRAFHAAHPDEEAFRDCRDLVDREWGHDRFPGGWHIIPNAGICITGLLYGKGDLGRSIEICVMCGFDTDCNASNVGTILGVFGGLDGVPRRYREPIRDSVILSGISGCLNMTDLPSLAKELAAAAWILRDDEDTGNGTGRGDARKEDAAGFRREACLEFDFELPGSTHGLMLSDRSTHSLRNTETEGCSGGRCLEVMIDGKRPGPADLYFTGCYIRSDLEDERYEPVFSPRVYPGQMVTCRLKALHTAPAAALMTPFVTLCMSGRRIDLEPVRVPEEWGEVSFVIPDAGGDQIHELGWRLDLKPDEDPWALSRIFIDRITVSGPMAYSVDFALQGEEFGQITPFSFSDCIGSLETAGEETALRLTMPEETTAQGCQAFTGQYYTRDVRVSAQAEISEGGSALLLVRGQGARRYCALGFAGAGRAAVLRYENGVCRELAAVPFDWKTGERYALAASAAGSTLSLYVNGEEILRTEEDIPEYGMTGLGMLAPGSTRWYDLQVSGS